MDLLGEFHEAGTALLVVTHDARVAAHADRVVFMADGRIVDELTPDGAAAAERTDAVAAAMRRLGI